MNKTTIIKYLKDIEEIKNTGIATELSYYGTFETFIKTIAPDGTRVISDAKKQIAGKPDFTILAKNGDLTGYIEAKKPGADLKSIENTSQIRGYKEEFSNFILTDFHNFRLYSNGKMVSDVCIDDEGLITDVSKTKPTEFTKLMNRFMSETTPIEPEVKAIAKRLAEIAKGELKPAIEDRLKFESNNKSGDLYGAYHDFKSNLIHNLTTEQFVDMYAQTITYGLLTAKMNHINDVEFNRKTASFDIPKSFRLLNAAFTFIATDDLPRAIEAAMDKIIKILVETNPGLILDIYYNENKSKDWFIHFYETFLAEYNAKERKVRGVYYTPDEVVSYITRSVNNILKTKFNKEIGFGTNGVRVFDPAAGTLSFLTSACQIAIDEMKATQGDGMIDGFIKNHILKDFYGFELMMTPYALGHLKMMMLLKENGYELTSEKIGLLLANTLDPNTLQEEINSPIGYALKKEFEEVVKVRNEKSIIAVIGNPPYSVSTANKRLFDKELKVYKDPVKGERSILSLSDDYIKFIRFAHKRIDDQGEGVIGFITNNSYLGGLVHRGMRKELMRSFDEIYILNLHGSVIDGKKGDKNVFDIKQGVSIAIFIKTSEITDDAKVYYSELIGSRESKYGYLNDNDINTTEWIELDANDPYYFFIPKDFSAQNDYDRFVSVSNIFKDRSIGITTSRDELAIHNTKKDVWGTVSRFYDMDIEEARKKYALGNDSGDWSIKGAQQDISKNIISREKIVDIMYRPFDMKSTYYTGQSNGFMTRPRQEIMDHLTKDNMALLTSRIEHSSSICHTSICDKIVDYHLIPNGTHVCPLYLYDHNTRTPNITPNIITTLTTTYNTTPTPEDIFYYIYGILHSNTYRQKYAELLKIDFPKIPFTPDHDMFMRVGAIGKQLADIHLMKPEAFNHSTIKYCGRGAHKVEKITYDESTQRVSINKAQYFDGVSADVWEYQIGGYKPMQKWLKDRRHDTLTADDVDHYRYIGAALERTMALQAEIDEVYGEIDAGEIIEFASDNAQTTL